ncbi:methylosome subunit pICln [Neocloeon triangulifer]|uniref:methylosome subunit pICln n=1 Tax=Neocloeon triangulifer TaxID=2078957 RepID=UPI00286EB4D2|nr:methylosome subunit pICln [Neocloeon triangulifer]
MVVLSSFREPSGEIRHKEANTCAFVNEKDMGPGTLYVAESILSWQNDATGEGFTLEYPHISLHAVSRDVTNFPHECLYLMLDADIENPEQNEDDDDEGGVTEVRFVPADKGVLQQLFEALKECQTLHPDPNDSFSEDEEFEGDGDRGLEIINNLANQMNSMNNGNNHGDEMDTEPGQFDDAD